MIVLFFARARDLAGTADVEIPVPAGGRVADLRRELAERFPRLAPLLPHCAIAVGDVCAADDAVLAEGDRAALLPPVSGGSFPQSAWDTFVTCLNWRVASVPNVVCPTEHVTNVLHGAAEPQ